MRAPPRVALAGVRPAQQLLASALAASLALSGLIAPPAGAAEDIVAVAGFEELAAKGGVMKSDPSCFFKQCSEPTTACFSNPACLKGITCLGNCRGEQLCATQCFARFGSEKLNSWLSCTLEEQECVTTGVAQDTTSFYETDVPPALPGFKPSDLEGRWYKVLGYNPKYDTYPCQLNTFTADGAGGLENDILFRVPKPDGSGSWQNNFKESMMDERGPQGKASMTVEGKMFGLTFHEQWYLVGKEEDFRVVAYRGDTKQGPYDGAFVFTRERDALKDKKLRAAVDGAVAAAGLKPGQMAEIDNECPDNSERAGVSATEASREKLEWKDLYELSEWFRPGTLKKNADFDPTKMM